MMTTSVYANMLAGFESSRLDDERLRRVVESGSVSDALKMLGDYGFPVADGTIDGFIVAATDELIAFVRENSANASATDALIAPFVYNNVKLAYKSRFVITPDAYYDCGLDNEKISRGEYDELDKALAGTLEKLDEGDVREPQAIDLAITRAMYKSVLSCKVKCVREYFKTEIDYKNLLTAARMLRLGMNGDEFIDGGNIKRAVLENVAKDDFADCFENTPYAAAAERIEENGFGELWQIERDADAHLLLMTERRCGEVASFEPFLHYYNKTRIELKKLKTALVCIKTNARAEFYKRVELG